MDDTYCLERAIALAREHSRDGRNGPFGAVIVRSGRIIAEGWNRVVETNDPTAHAEINAIRNACTAIDSYNLAGCTLYCSCEPCPMCLAAAYWARVERVVYAATGRDAAAAGFDDVVIRDELTKDPAKRSIKIDHVPLVSATQVFADWADNDRKVPY